MPASSLTRAPSPRTRSRGRAGAEALREARNQFGREGVEIKTLRRCDPEGRDGEGLALRYLAFGIRHHPRDSNAPTVYEIADRRFHDEPS
ncbi:MAG: hypothetical protein WA862_03215 [Solirubrobacterales bacterium]